MVFIKFVYLFIFIKNKFSNSFYISVFLKSPILRSIPERGELKKVIYNEFSFKKSTSISTVVKAKHVTVSAPP